jgi:hypothetical protein
MMSPVKLLFVFIVAVIVLGPDKVPAMARKVGKVRSDLRRLHERLESEVRDIAPDLPSTHEIVRMVRSPMSYLDQWGGIEGDPTTTSDDTITFTLPGTDPIPESPDSTQGPSVPLEPVEVAG